MIETTQLIINSVRTITLKDESATSERAAAYIFSAATRQNRQNQLSLRTISRVLEHGETVIIYIIIRCFFEW